MSDPTRSCLNCPSYLKKDEVAGVFGKSIGAPMCARYGKVLGAPDILPVAEAKMQEQVAASCPSYGKPAPDLPQGYLQTEVTFPHPDALQETSGDPASDSEKALVNSCLGCKFYVPDSEVLEEHGWAGGLCGVTGRIIIPGRQSREARECDYRKMGRQELDVSAMHLIPMYAEAKSYDPSPLGRWKKAKENGTRVDPTEYVSDAPVSDEDEAFGIRAWRRIEDPNGTGNSVLLPIFRRDYFSSTEQVKIPATGDPEHPEDYIDSRDYVYSAAVMWMALDVTPALWGPPGVGKTELGRHLAWLMQVPFDRISFTREMEVEDIIGKMMFIDGETKFQWGRLPHAWVKPSVLLFDEPNAAPDAVWQRVRPITDNSKQLILDEAGAEVVSRHEYCFLMMAMNPAWDSRNAGVSEMADADVSRLAHVFMNLPPRAVEEEILKTACEKDGWMPDDELLSKVFQTSEEVRALVADGSLPVSWGVRENLKVIRTVKWFDPVTAYRRAVADVLEPQVRELVLGLVRTGWDLEATDTREPF